MIIFENLKTRITYRLLDESPRWLFARGRFQEADAIVRKMLKRNKKEHEIPAQGFFDAKQLRQVLSDEESNQFNESVIEHSNECSTDNENYGMIDLFRSPRLRLRTLAVGFIWYVFLFTVQYRTF